MPVPVRWKWKIDRLREKLQTLFEQQPKEPARPKLCPACGKLVGSAESRCFHCGTSVKFSLAATTGSLARFLPQESPATYAILTLSCVLYAVALAATVARGSNPAAGGIFGLGSASGLVLQRLGQSDPLPFDLAQPWRLVTAIFLHHDLLHIGFNMWVLMDIGPMVEETYGSARYLFIYVVTGAAGFLASSAFGNFSVGGSGALLGLVGVLLAITGGRESRQALRGQLIRWLIYIAVMGFMLSGVDNYAHAGGALAGYVCGKVMAERQPEPGVEREHAQFMGWAAALAIVLSFALAVVSIRVGGR